MSLPLEGVRILDLTRLLPGPLCSLMLADLGAEVIKLEPPMGGDYARWFPPMRSEMSGAFAALNRGKRSLALDLKNEVGAAAFLRMVKRVDVVLEGFRPGVMERLGVGPEKLCEQNPRLIYCAITGYGQEGPYALRAGHDINYLATTGVLSLLGGESDGAPQVGGIQIADIAGGSWSAVGHILAALFRRERTGKGAICDVSMSEGVLPFLTMAMGEWSAGGELPLRSRGVLRGEMPCYGVYRCADGQYLAVGALEPKFWMSFVNTLGAPHLANDGLETGEAGARVRREVEDILKTRTRAQWMELFAESDACVEPVLTVEEATHDPHNKARGYFLSQHHPTEGELVMTRSPFRLDGVSHTQLHAAPGLGQHSEEIMRELGFSAEEIASLRAAGALLQPEASP